MSKSKHYRKGKSRPRVNIKSGSYPSVKRSIASVIVDRIKAGEVPYSTSEIRKALKEGF